ncbi:MAG: dTMP kinase [Candidatus Nitrosopumilus limneticus]|nr:dTMP kinase [Candidatus Nitrosopumilus limneticus]
MMHSKISKSIQKRSPIWYSGNSHVGIPYLKNIKISGRLIVIEGPDGSGRSAQIEMLTSRLEADGFAVLNTGLKRSDLIGEGILEAKRNISLGKKTLALFYAADFADELEHKIIPALQSGYVVLADRYIYTLIARNNVRGLKRKWSSDLYSFALVPDLVFYLNVNSTKLVHRVFEKRMSLDYYESGSDLGLSDDMYESFLIYQSKMADEFARLKKKYDLITIDGNKSILDVNLVLQRQIRGFLKK